MSCEIDSDSFHGIKKGDRRKTVSKRRAYYDTPDELKNKIFLNQNLILFFVIHLSKIQM